MVTAGLVELRPYLAVGKMRKAEIRLQPVGTALVRCLLVDFDEQGNFPDRLELRLLHATGLPTQVPNPRVRITVANEVVITDPPRGFSKTSPRRAEWDQRFIMPYNGNRLCVLEVLDESGDTLCTGRFLLWEVLTQPQKAIGGEIDLTDENTAPAGLLRVAFRMWDTANLKKKSDAHNDRLRELEQRRKGGVEVLERCRETVKDTDKKPIQEAERKYDSAKTDLNEGKRIAESLEIPAASKTERHDQKKNLKSAIFATEKKLEAAERFLQMVVHSSAVKEWEAGRAARGRIDAVVRDMESALEPLPGSDGDDELESINVTQLEPLVQDAQKEILLLNDALADVKHTPDPQQMVRHYENSVEARSNLETLAGTAAKIGAIAQRRLRERRRLLRQHERSNVLVVTAAAGEPGFARPMTIPAPCCCWL